MDKIVNPPPIPPSSTIVSAQSVVVSLQLDDPTPDIAPITTTSAKTPLKNDDNAQKTDYTCPPPIEGGTDRYKIGNSYRDDDRVLWFVKQCGFCESAFLTRSSKAHYCQPKHRVYAHRARSRGKTK